MLTMARIFFLSSSEIGFVVAGTALMPSKSSLRTMPPPTSCRRLGLSICKLCQCQRVSSESAGSRYCAKPDNAEVRP